MSEFNQTRSFNLGLAQETSIEAALIYDDLAYAQQMVGKGRWFYRSYEQLENRLPFSTKTLQRHAEKLVAAGFIEKKIMKVDGVPKCHWQVVKSIGQIDRMEKDKLTESMEKDKLTESIYKTTKETTKGSDTRSVSLEDHGQKARARQLLPKLIHIVNAKEKATDDRLRILSARLKEYTDDEVINAARAFSKSEWHRENGEMHIDNLLRPSKFGRWYAEGLKLQPAAEAPARDMEKERQEEYEEAEAFRQGRIDEYREAKLQGNLDLYRKKYGGAA